MKSSVSKRLSSVCWPRATRREFLGLAAAGTASLAVPATQSALVCLRAPYLQNVIGNKFDPADFFADAKILGGVKLAELLKIAASLAGGDVPKFLSRELPDKIEASFDWQTVIKQSDGLGLFVHSAGGPTNFEMHGLISSPIGKPNATTFNANASITNFKINLFGFITIWFDALAFTAKSGTKPDVSVDLHPGDETVAFGGPLEFVNKLREIIPSNGFTDPPSLSLTPSGIAATPPRGGHLASARLAAVPPRARLAARDRYAQLAQQVFRGVLAERRSRLGSQRVTG